jgi:phthalate 4,5-dioxygenase oxygenase subunit
MKREENDLLCRVGPGTPMGEVMRRYWQPALLSSDLERDAAPRRLRLLGEDLVAFRDSNGRVGVFDEHCAHRGASLALGRVEDGGIKCLFHGWHYAADGTILERPNTAKPREPAPYKALAYPARESGDIVWVYMGPAERQPPFRELEFMTVPGANRFVVRRDMDCNYLQVLEGGLDSAHVAILHSDVNRKVDGAQKREVTSGEDSAALHQANPELEVRDTDFGFDYAALRAGRDLDEINVRVTPFVMPNMVMIPPGTHVIFYIPYDDTHCSWVVAFWSREKPIDRARQLKIMGLDRPGLWVNDRLMLSKDNNYGQDREAMQRGSWTGLAGFTLEDAAMSLSQGTVNDRTKEHLVPSDVAVTRARRLFLDSIRLVQAGEDPIGLRPAEPLGIRATEGNVPRSSPWSDVVPGHRAREPEATIGDRPATVAEAREILSLPAKRA